MATDKKTVPLNIRKFPVGLHKKLKILAAEKETSMQSLVISLLERGMNDEGKG